MPPNLAEDASCGRALAEVHILFPKVLLYHIISCKTVALNIQPHWVQLRLFSNPSLFVHHMLMEKQCHFFSIITFNNNHFFVVINDMLSNKTEVYKKQSDERLERLATVPSTCCSWRRIGLRETNHR